MMDRMRHAANLFGVTEGTPEVVEALYLEFLEALNAHFARFPTSLGVALALGTSGCWHRCTRTWERDPIRLR